MLNQCYMVTNNIVLVNTKCWWLMNHRMPSVWHHTAALKANREYCVALTQLIH